MLKRDFIAALRYAIRGLPARDINEHIAFYEELIEDKIEEGMSEERAVRSLGGVDKVSSQIIAQTPLRKIVKEKITPSGGFGALGITLIIIGSPIWLALLISALAVVISVYAVIVAVAVSLFAVEVALIAVLPCGIGLGVYMIFSGFSAHGLLTVGAALFSGGLSFFFFFVCKWATRGLVWLSARIFIGIKSIFVRGRF